MLYEVITAWAAAGYDNAVDISAQAAWLAPQSDADADALTEADVDIEIPDSGFTGVFGESGSGKTTLLRCIAGLEGGEGPPVHRRASRPAREPLLRNAG